MAGPYGANIFNPRGWASNNGAWTHSLVAEPTLMPFPLPFFLDIFCHLSRSHVTLTPTHLMSFAHALLDCLRSAAQMKRLTS